jgi:hypothetical protein
MIVETTLVSSWNAGEQRFAVFAVITFLWCEALRIQLLARSAGRKIPGFVFNALFPLSTH